jgi:type I restriction enzyme S subunit
VSNDITLPINWFNARFGELCKVQGGNAFRSQDYQASGVPLVRIGNLISNEIAFPESTVFLPESFLAEFPGFVLNQGDVLIAMSGATTGKMGVFRHNGPALLNQRVGRFQFKEEIKVDQRFAALLVEKIRDLVVKTAYGAAQPNISPSQIEEMEVPLPPFNEQLRIVSKIEELFSDLDAGVAALKRAKANLKRYRAAVLKAAVEGKLTEEWRTKHPAQEPASALLARILKERRQKWEADQLAKFAAAGKEPPKNWQEKYVEPTPPDTTDLPQLPEGWKYGSLEQLTSAARPICYGILMPKENVPQGVLYVKVKDMKGDRIDLAGLQRTTEAIATDFSRASLKAGDWLLSIRGTYGRVAEVPIELEGGNITQDTARLDITIKMSKDFVASAMRGTRCQNYFKRVARGVAVKGVNIADVRRCPIPICSFAEQLEVANLVGERFSQIEAAETEIHHSLVRAARLRQSILKRAFEGKLVPQDPKDEPAGVLLERLRAKQSIQEGKGKPSHPTRSHGGRRVKSNQLEGRADE